MKNVFAWTEPAFLAPGYVRYLSLNEKASGELVLATRNRDGVAVEVPVPASELLKLASAILARHVAP